jgi:GT2 family glycosyltransferase
MDESCLELRAAVLVLTRNRRELVLESLHSVFAQDYATSAVVVVDNGSDDGTHEAIAERFPSVCLLRNRANLGAAGGRNVGLRFLSGNVAFDVLLFLDDDSQLDPAFLRSLVAALRDDEHAGIACGKGYVHGRDHTLRSAGTIVNLYTGAIRDIGVGETDCGQFDTRRYVDASGASGLLVKRAVVDKLQAFDEAFNPYGWEDIDLCLRARGEGFACVYVPEAIAFHRGGKIGRGPVLEYERSKARNYLLLLRKHASATQKLSLAISVPIRMLGSTLSTMATGDFTIVRSQAKEAFRSLFR